MSVLIKVLVSKKFVSSHNKENGTFPIPGKSIRFDQKSKRQYFQLFCEFYRPQILIQMKFRVEQRVYNIRTEFHDLILRSFQYAFG